ncbi:MAG: hypothetical protein NC187_08135 [Candidatus Amulumruptor caecigallinarius]|nr:hypothetical protein [Candidatus Amulumruptor caecigallinarius]MCM1397437.1 hypothetical protein [Candidatus Amulumruptor caecigallinarius]MCM1454355.1 hypothetical protein [bacterium]
MGKASTEDYQTATGLSMPVVVFLVFLILKLTDLIEWSWWWVTSPLWIVAGLIILTALISTAAVYVRYKRDKRRH